MVSSLGYQLAKNSVISGFGHRHHHVHRGRGVARRALGGVARTLGNMLVNRVANAIAGGSYKITGRGRKPRKPRSRLSGFGTRKRTTHRAPKRHTTTRRRAPKKHLSGGGRYRSIYRRRVLY